MIRRHNFLRAALGTLMLAFLVSCGGGSEVSGGSVSGSLTGDGFTLGGSSGGDGTGGNNSTGGDGSSGGSGSASTGGDNGSTSTAGNTSDDGSGVGSGGTGATADAGTSVGAVDGMGSIIVGGVRYNTDNTPAAAIDLRDAPDWALGMTVLATGPVDPDFKKGTALKLKSMAQMRGTVDSVNASSGSFQLLGSIVSVDQETVWADLAGLANLAAGAKVQVWALPVASGELRATRIQTQGVAGPTLVTGVVSGLDADNKTFQLGSLVVDYGAAATMPADGLTDGRIVRVAAAAAPVGGYLRASGIEGWYALSTVAEARVQLEGVIADFDALSKRSFKLMGVAIDATGAQIPGGQEDNLGNGVRVVASGTLSSSGVLVASKLRLRHVPGGAAPAFDLHGNIGNYNSPSDMKVRGQRVDASTATFVNGSAQQLGHGVRVRVQGTQVVDGVLRVTILTFE